MTAPESAPSETGGAHDPRYVWYPRIGRYSSSPDVIDVPGEAFRRVVAVAKASPAREFFHSPIVKAVSRGSVKVNPAYDWTNSKISAVELLEHTKELRALALTICAKDTVPRRQVTRIVDTTPIHWELPGHGSKTRDSCGVAMGVDCCPKGHSFQPYYWYCGNPRCPACFPHWASCTNSLVSRVSNLGQLMDGPDPSPDWAGMGLYHAILSPPQEMSIGALGIVDGKRAFDDMINIACAIIGFHGTWNLHPWRHGKGRDVVIWRDGPHVHMVGWLNPEVAIDIAQKVLVPKGWIFKIVHYKRGMDTPWAVDDEDDLDGVYGPNGVLDDAGAKIVLRYIRSHAGLGIAEGRTRRYEVGRWVGLCARTNLRTLVDSDHYVDPDPVDEPMLGMPEGGMDDPELWGMTKPKPPKRVPMRLRCYCAQCKERIVHTWPVRGGLETSGEFERAYETAIDWGDTYYRGRLARKQYRVIMCFKEDFDAIRALYGDIDGLHLEAEALRRLDRRIACWSEDTVAEVPPNSQWDSDAHEWKDYEGPVEHLHNDNPHARMARYLRPAPSPSWPAPRLPRDIVRSPPPRR